MLYPGRQKTGAVAKLAILRKGAGVHGLAVEAVLARHGGAAAGQEGRHQQSGVKGPQLGLQQLALQGEMAPQGGIPPTQQQPAIDHAGLPGGG